MAKNGSTTVAATSWDSIKFSWSEVSQDVLANTTTVEWRLELIAGAYGRISSSTYKSWSVTVNGATYSGSNLIGIANNATKKLASGTTVIAHAADGSKTFSYSFSQQLSINFAGAYVGTISGSGSGALDTIPRATTPTFYASSVDMGGTATIYLNRAVTTFVHDLYYSFAGSEFKYIAGDLTTVHYWAVPDLASQIPSATSGTITIRCVTRSGTTTIGTKDATFTVRVPGSVMPTISAVTATEATEGLAAQFGVFVKDKTTLSVKVTAAGAKGSTIKSCTTTLNGINYSGLQFVSGVLTVAGEVSLVTTVTDTRNRSVKLTTKVNVQDYYPPATTKLKVYRVDENGIAKSDGDYLCAEYAYNVAPVGNKNTPTVTIEYKRSTETRWTVLQSSSAFSADTVRAFTTKLTSDYQFDIMLRVVDKFGAEASYTATLPTAKVILDFKANGKGIAVGKTAEFDGFEVDMAASAESFKLAGVRSYEMADGSGYILYNNGLLIQWGAVSVTPTAINTVTQLQVIFPVPYKHRPHITGTLLANSPQVVDWSMGVGTSDAAALSGLVVYMSRSTLHATPFRWMAVGLADATKLPEVTAE